MQKNNSNDTFLWTAFKKGDKKAFQVIYQTYVPALLNYGSKITTDASLVEDCIQDLFIELWKSSQRLNDTSSIKFYLFKALRNKINRNQSPKNGFTMLPLEGFMTLLKTSAEEEKIIQRETKVFQLQYLNEALDLLPARQREAISLRYYHNFSNEEITQIMGINYNSVCKFIHAALKNLKENLKVAVSILYFLVAIG